MGRNGSDQLNDDRVTLVGLVLGTGKFLRGSGTINPHFRNRIEAAAALYHRGKVNHLLLSGDNIYRDGCVGNIDAHHGSDIPDFIESLRRIRNSSVEWLLPSHGPIFRKENALLDATIRRLETYQVSLT